MGHAVQPKREICMKLTSRMTRSLQADMQAELRDLERAAAVGTKEAGRGLKTDLRRQVTSAGLGQRLARSWRDKHTRTSAWMRPAWSIRKRLKSSELSTRAR